MTTPTNGVPASPLAQPAAKPGAAPAQPAAPQKSPEWVAAETRAAELEQRLAGADKKLRVNGIEVMKVANEKKAMGAKLTAHDRMEKALKAAGVSVEDLEQFKANPRRVLAKVLGDGDYDKAYNRVVDERLSGGAPTGDVLASELQRTKEEIRAELRAEAEAEKTASQKAAQDRDEQARAQITAEAGAHLAKSKAEYPGLEQYQPDTIAKAVAQYIEREFHRTGKVLSAKEAADKVEWLDVAARFARGEELGPKTIEKHRPQLLKLTEKLGPATVAPVAPKPAGQASRGVEVERRTLSNDLTATTSPAKRTHRTDEERLAAIQALDLGR